jgi:glycosyltransferase involved in cell wall biosynthesis
MAEGLKSTGNEGLPFKLHVFGPQEERLTARAGQLGVAPWVVNHGVVSRQAALEAVAGAHEVVVVTSVQDTADTAVRGIVTGKVFEALGLGKKILLVAPEGADVEAIVGPNGRRFSGSQVGDIAQHLLNSLASETPAKLTPPRACCWEQQALICDAVLEEAMRGKTPGRY